MAYVPDFGALAYQQQGANDDATRRTTWSSRPDQTNALGSISWNQDPSGRWINNTTLNGAAQGLFDTTMGGQTALAGRVGQGVNYGNLPAMPDSGFGASQQVIDAWNALQQPGLNKQADAARARAAAMGLTIGSNAWGDVENTIGTNQRNAMNEGILRGTTEYQNVFNRGLAARQQAASEAEKSYASSISGLGALTGVRDSLDPNKWATKVPTGAAYTPLNLYGAAGDTLAANIANENQDAARRGQNISGAASLLGAAGGLGGVGSLLSGAASGIGNLWGGYYGTGANTYGSTFWNGGTDDLTRFLDTNQGYGTYDPAGDI